MVHHRRAHFDIGVLHDGPAGGQFVGPDERRNAADDGASIPQRIYWNFPVVGRSRFATLVPLPASLTTLP